jgi:hypothetical protein
MWHSQSDFHNFVLPYTDASLKAITTPIEPIKKGQYNHSNSKIPIEPSIICSENWVLSFKFLYTYRLKADGFYIKIWALLSFFFSFFQFSFLINLKLFVKFFNNKVWYWLLTNIGYSSWRSHIRFGQMPIGILIGIDIIIGTNYLISFFYLG